HAFGTPAGGRLLVPAYGLLDVGPDPQPVEIHPANACHGGGIAGGCPPSVPVKRLAVVALDGTACLKEVAQTVHGVGIIFVGGPAQPLRAFSRVGFDAVAV